MIGDANTSSRERTLAGNYKQNWAAYNAAQTNERPLFLKLLYELCRGVEELDGITERSRLPLRDMFFCMVYKIYSGRSSRRLESELMDLKTGGWISVVPHFNSISNYMKSESLKPILQQRVRESCAPLRAIENRFAVDSTGLGIPLRQRYYDRHRERFRTKRGWVKLHAMGGVQTNIITSAEVSTGDAGDSSFFQYLVGDTARDFEMTEVYADAGYTGNGNRRCVLIWGAEPYIAFRSNSVSDGEPKSTLWKRMLQQFQDKESEFWKRYYLRNNIEATFSMMKRKFGDRLRGKSFSAQVNEALCMVLCHNLCVVIQEMYELGINPEFHTDLEERQPAHGMKGQDLIKVRERIAALIVKQPSLPEFLENTRQDREEAAVTGVEDSSPPASAPPVEKKARKKKDAPGQVKLF